MTQLFNKLKAPANIAPLAFFRMLFGGMMFLAMLRFLAKGWVKELYVDTPFHFKYFGFEWVEPLGLIGTHALFIAIGLFALLVALGLFYRFSISAFFLLFTYAELMDATNYLNHYYFISIVAFLMIWLPAHRNYSFDSILGFCKRVDKVPRFTILTIQLQLAIVYFFAGLAKINSDWLLEAQPLSLWLRSFYDWPVLGNLFEHKATAYFFAWTGCIYDLSIIFLLWYRRTRPFAFAAVVFFHVITYLMFPIGMFPFIMIGSTLIFFRPSFHQNILKKIWGNQESSIKYIYPKATLRILLVVFAVHFTFQIFWPLRSHFYTSNVFWTEEGYRFSWKVMLTDKSGVAFFKVTDSDGKMDLVDHGDFLCPRQERMLATRPDFMVQYAKHLKKYYQDKEGYKEPKVFVEGYLNLNGKGSKLFTDANYNLAEASYGFKPKKWILNAPK